MTHRPMLLQSDHIEIFLIFSGFAIFAISHISWSPTPWEMPNMANPEYGKSRTMGDLTLSDYLDGKRHFQNNSDHNIWLKVCPLTAWDKAGIPLQLRASQLNNLKTTRPNFIKIEIGFSRTVSTRIPKYHKILRTSGALHQIKLVQFRARCSVSAIFRTQSICTNLSKDDQMIISEMSFPELYLLYQKRLI